ncbi:VENN motif pre-toxin domain-containing protein [Pantoea anthophila]|uniref:VENN motif pre-toxin domain-containing protein n=1 Tax=Pantoea anthophila TaxID=470931 RepID=UPI00301C0ED8
MLLVFIIALKTKKDPCRQAELIKQKAPDEASRIMAHVAVAGVVAAAQGNSAAAGAATTAAMGEAIKKVLYGDVPVSQMSEQQKQKQTLLALGTVAAGLAGGLTGNGTADAVARAQAGQNEISNNLLGMGMLQQMLTQETLNSAAMAEAGKGGANEQAALALTKAVKEGLGSACLANDACVLMAVVAAQNQQHTNGAGSKTETVPVDDDLTGGKLVNPVQEENKGTTLVTPGWSGEQEISNTGNTDGLPDMGGNTTVTPVPEQNKDDLAYLAEGRDNRLPIPESTTASNGLKVESNTKDTPGAQGFRPDAGIEPRNSLELFESSVATKDPKIRLSIDQNGNIHRFFNAIEDGSGIFHWSGSTGDPKNKLGNRDLGSFNKEIKQLKGKS